MDKLTISETFVFNQSIGVFVSSIFASKINPQTSIVVEWTSKQKNSKCQFIEFPLKIWKLEWN